MTVPTGTEATAKPSVLFVCVHNAGRSQMAAAYLRTLGEGRIEVRSAGSAPGHSVNPAAVEAMAEDGIDMSAELPKVLTIEAVRESDVVITMGCGDACPIFPGKRYEDWELEDPAGQGVAAVRPIRDEIKARIQDLIADLLPALPVAVIGAGPVGLAAAAQLRERGLTPIIFEAGPTPAAAVAAWGHIRLFSPWQYNIDAAARRLLTAAGWQEPDAQTLPTGAELWEQYLQPLAAVPAIAGALHTSSRVLAVSREGLDKTRTGGRETTPFLLRVEDAQGAVTDYRASAVIDASGTWHTPNPLGRAGLAAPGEAQAYAAGLITRPLPDVLGRDRGRFVGQHVLVVGAGHSAANTLLALGELAAQEPGMRISWAIRSSSAAGVYGGGDLDGLPARGALGSRLQALVQEGLIELHPSFTITGFKAAGRLTVAGSTPDGQKQLDVDLVVPATGFRPDLDLLREIRLDLDPVVEAPRELGPLIDPEFHSCGTVTPHGAGLLSHPEKDFYIVGMKSYGRAPTFLMATGYEQVRSIAAALAGDQQAADDVQLVLPETGVCSTDLGGSCDAPAAEPAPTSCCTAPEPAFLGIPTGLEHGRSRLSMTERQIREVDVLVIGGGQAGLAAGYYLNRLRRDEAAGRSGPAPTFAILDANAEPGGAWQHYWNSLELFSPAAYSSLPGYQMPAWAGEGNPSADHVAHYLRTYEARYDLPVHRPARVTAVRRSESGSFSTDTDRGKWNSRVVINATGSWKSPEIPQLPGSDRFTGQQLHTADYRGPDPFVGLSVVVVGGGNSGAQIAADLIPAARVTWVTRKPPRFLPDDVDGRVLFSIATGRRQALAAGKPAPPGIAELGDIVAVPAVRKARDAGLLQARPMFSRLVPAGVQWEGGERLDADVLIWCTGFRPDLRHLQPLGLTTRNGVPATAAALPTRSVDDPNLFFLGYGDWCGPSSATLIGVGATARDSVSALTNTYP